MTRQFVQLHNHSAYSLLDGKSPVKELAATAARFKNPAVAITDHGGMPGAVRFITACKEYGVTPIVGQEFYFARDVQTHVGNSDVQKGIFHQIILARNKTGYNNLIRLSSRAYREGFYKSPRIDLDMLADHSAGLIGTTSCLSGVVNDHLLKGEFEEACQWASDFADVFDPGCYYVEIQNHGIADQLAILDMQVKLAKRLGLPLVATNDSHYIEHEDCDAHDDLLCVGTGALKNQEKRFRFSSDENYFRSPDEMWELFPERDFPGACSNTLSIAEMCEVHDPTKNDLLIPRFDYESEGFSSSGEMLRAITFDGARTRFGNSRGEISQEVQQRHEHELSVIDKMGYNDYFLIVMDIMRAARERGIRYAPGRGSAAGSAVAYSTGITGVDPFAHGLFFERFLNEGRGGMPDIDIDFDKFRRQEMVDYTVEKYGEDHVAKVATYSFAGVKASIKSAARIMGLSYRVPDIYAVMNTDKHPLSLQMAEERDLSWDDGQAAVWKDAKALRDLAEGSEVGAIMHSALGIEGAITAKGTGAAALLITPTPVTDNFPVHNSKSHTLPVSQYDKVDIEECGALKMDFLGLKNISLVDNALHRVEDDFGKVIDLDTLPLDDPATFRLIRDCEVDGIFQIESEGMRGVIKAMMPTSFQDISALIALYRPGPMASNAHMSYADRKNGREEVIFEIPESEEILGETWAMPVYQEQIMALAQKYAGYSLREADDFRRAMGKKKPEVMEAMHSEFLERVEAHGHSKQIGARLWDIILPFAGYAFNRAHSASYGLVSYQTAFLKARYPHQFVAAFIDSMSPDRYTPIIDWTKRVGVELRPVDINESYETSLSGKDFVRLGFNTVREVGFGPQYTIVAERTRNGDYDSIRDFVARTIDNTDAELNPVRRPALASLIKAGAFDGLHESRIKLLDNLDDIMADARPKAKRRKREQSVFGDMIGDDPFGQTSVVRKDDEFSGDQSHVEKMRMEFESCGFSLRPHPFTLIRDSVTHLRQHGEREFMLADHDDLTPGRNSRIVGNIFEIKNDVSKKSKKYSRFVLSTGYRSENIVTCVIFGEHLSSELIGELALVHGSLRAEEQTVIVNADGDYDEDDASGYDERMTEVRHTWEVRADKIVLQRAWNDLAEDGENIVAFDSRGVESKRQGSDVSDTRHKSDMRSRIARRTDAQDAVALVRRKRKAS